MALLNLPSLIHSIEELGSVILTTATKAVWPFLLFSCLVLFYILFKPLLVGVWRASVLSLKLSGANRRLKTTTPAMHLHYIDETDYELSSPSSTVAAEISTIPSQG